MYDNSEDIILTDDILYTNNTFNLEALKDTIEKLSVTNFWNLYQAQRSRMQMKKFCIRFNDFIPTTRLQAEKNQSFYPKRRIAYVDYTFIPPELRRKYRNSEFYNVAVDQFTISKNPDIFYYNYLIFIDGEYIFTTEVYPNESKLGIIIDLENTKNTNGITYERYLDYSKRNPMVDIILLPNFHITTASTNNYVLENLNYKIPFNRIEGSEHFTEDTICFVNMTNEISRRYFENGIYTDMDKGMIEVDLCNIIEQGTYQFCFITFPLIYDIIELDGEPHFQLDTKMPCPVEQMIVFRKQEDGKYVYDCNKQIDLYYPNIYKVNNLEDNDTVLVYIFQDEEELTRNEKYFNEIQKYEEYIELLPKYDDGSIPEILKNYKPSSYAYSIDDYKNSMYVPNVMNYQVQKLHHTIRENPWALATYLDLLNLPTDKFYLDMEKFDLEERKRMDTLSEDLEEGISPVTFDEEYYVFSINRNRVNNRRYGFRIFIDGYFQTEDVYKVFPGEDFYYIYIQADKITNTSMIELERYSLFNFEITRRVPDDINDVFVEMELDDVIKTAYAREIYVVDTTTNLYLKKGKEFKVDVLYKFSDASDKWITIPNGKNIPIEHKFRVYILDEKYSGRLLKVGINRTMGMKTGTVYHTPDDDLHDFSIFEYDQLDIPNQGGYDLGNYRVFNNGKLLLPIQYYLEPARYQGANDIIRTSCELREGDQFTSDRVPARFVMVYYQHEVDSEGKKGYVDLEGKIELPISLKWYDIYINGVKLHKKNIEIISPTKFYIQGVESRKNLMILMKNRDPEVFKLASREEYEQGLTNGTIMDQLMDEIYTLKSTIDATKEVIDSDNSSIPIASNVAINQMALIFFYEYFVYTFINANHKQITQEIKDTFPSLINEQGIMEIDPNAGCVDSKSIGGYLIKLIECNKSEWREEDMFTKDGVDYDGLGLLQDRFAIRPLNTDNYEYGLPQEFMCDPETGEPAIMNEDGTVTTVSTLFRTKNYIEHFSQQIMMYGMGKADIYQITFDEEFKVQVYDGRNIITEDISTEIPVNKIAIGLDATFMRKVGESKMLRVADVDPTVVITYLDGDDEKTIKHTITRLPNYIIETSGKVITLKSITLEGIDEWVKTFIHSLLLAF